MRALKELCHCYPAHLDVNNANYASLFALELEKLPMTKLQRRVKQICLSTNNSELLKSVRLTALQKPQLPSVSIVFNVFSFFSVFVVIFICFSNVLRGYFYVSLNLVALFAV